jgi:DTW domain-containing protein YfiP
MNNRAVGSRDNPREVCYRCRRPAVTCLCAHITTRSTRTRFVLLTHPMESKKEKNGSGRAAHLSLSNSEIVVGVDFSDDPRVNALIEDPRNDCHLLYPGATAVNLSRGEYQPGPGKTPVLFLIDSTWPCAKKVMRLSVNLRKLPRLSFDNTDVSEFYIKQQPHPICLSTVESLNRVLELFGSAGLEEYGPDDGRKLLEPFRRMVQMQIDYAADPTIPHYRPSGGYRPPSERRVSLKHTRRNVV